MLEIDAYLETMSPQLITMDTKATYVSIASLATDATFFGDNYNYAIALRMAHLFELDSRGDNNAGFITSKTEGRVSVSYWNSPNQKSQSDLHTTRFGKTLLGLIHRIGVSASTSNTCVSFS